MHEYARQSAPCRRAVRRRSVNEVRLFSRYAPNPSAEEVPSQMGLLGEKDGWKSTDR